MLKRIIRLASTTAALAALAWVPAQAKVVTLAMHWGTPDSGAQADGTVTLDIPIYQTGGFSIDTAAPIDFHLTVSGATVGNGTFDKLAAYYWWYPSGGYGRTC